LTQYEIEEGHPKQRARQLRRHGVNDQKVGATQILKELHKEFGKDDSRVPTTPRQVHNWIKDVEWQGEDKPCDFKEVSPELRSFTKRIDLVKSAYLGGLPLTYRESRHAKRALTEFQDPYGDVVDLVAQYAVIWELAEREAMDNECADIETMFAFAPWRDKVNSDLYFLSVQKGLIKNAPILRLISPVTPYGESPSFTEVMFGAYAQLGLPWFFGWVQEHPDGQRFMLNNRREDSEVPMTIDHWKHACDWRKLIEARLTDQPTENVRIQIEREVSND
jgi:hypothetical protein